MDILAQGYWIMPFVIMYDKDLKNIEKLIYCCISWLCAERWYCRASNKYIWDLFGITTKSVSSAVSKLIDKWYLSSQIDKKIGNNRILTLSKKFSIPMEKIFQGYGKNFPHNNNSIYISNIGENENSTNLENVNDYTDIQKVVTNDEYRHNNYKLLMCLMKMVEIWYKIPLNEKTIKDEVNRFKDKCKIYEIMNADWSVWQWEMLQIVDQWNEYHKWKNDVKNYKSSVLTFIKHHKKYK